MLEPPLPPHALALCASEALIDGGEAVSFDLCHEGQHARAFAVRYEGQAVAYLNRCAHISMEMDWQANRFFDADGQWLLCATHGAAYHPHTGVCVAGPCVGARLIPVPLVEHERWLYWLPEPPFQPLSF